VYRVGLGQHVEQYGRDRENDGINPRSAFPSQRDNKERCRKVGHGSADIAGPENAQSGALALFFEPARCVGDTDDERSASKAETECCDKKDPIGLHAGQKPDRDGGDQHLQRKHDPATELLGPDAKKDPTDRAGQYRCGHQQAELGVAQSEFLFDLNTDN